mgnify:CR=1 FL=1
MDDEGNKVFMDAAKDDAFIQKLGVNPICVPSRQSVAATDMLLPEWHIRLDKQLAKYVRSHFLLCMFHHRTLTRTMAI